MKANKAILSSIQGWVTGTNLAICCLLEIVMKDSQMDIPLDTTLETAAINVSLAFSAISACLLLAIITFLFKFESKKRVFAPFNLILVTGSASALLGNLSLFFENRQLRDSGSSAEQTILSPAPVLNMLAIATAEFCYVYGSWLRSKLIIERAFPRNIVLLKYLLHASPILFYIQVIPAVLAQIPSASISINNILQRVGRYLSGLATLSFDTIFVISFVRFLNKPQDAESLTCNDKLRLKIISRFGVVSASVAYLILFLYSMGVFFGNQAFLQVFIVAISTGLMSIIFTIMFLMKISLFRYDERENRMSIVQQKDSSGSKSIKDPLKS